MLGSGADGVKGLSSLSRENPEGTASYSGSLHTQPCPNMLPNEAIRRTCDAVGDCLSAIRGPFGHCSDT